MSDFQDYIVSKNNYMNLRKNIQSKAESSSPRAGLKKAKRLHSRSSIAVTNVSINCLNRSLNVPCSKIVDESLGKTMEKLKSLHAQIMEFREMLQSGYDFDMEELARIQEEADAIDSKRVENCFVDAEGNVPKGRMN
jgi:hypothetical protein